MATKRCPAMILALLLASACVPAMAAGRWVAESQTPTLRQQGLRYTSDTLSPKGGTPLAGTAISRVEWRYDFAGWRPRALKVRLCGGGRCIDAAQARGQSMAFEGLPVATGFRFEFLIDGRPATRAPLEGGALTLMVNFR